MRWLAIPVLLLLSFPLHADEMGIVTDASGQPVEGAVVFGVRQILERDQFQFHSSQEARCYAINSAVTGSEGRFELADPVEWARMGYLSEGTQLQVHVIAPGYRSAVRGFYQAYLDSHGNIRNALSASDKVQIRLRPSSSSVDIEPFLVDVMKDCLKHDPDMDDALPGFVQLFRTADLSTPDFDQRGVLNQLGRIAVELYRDEHGGPDLPDLLTNEQVRHVLTSDEDSAWLQLNLRDAVTRNDVSDMMDLVEEGANPTADEGHQRSLLWTAMVHEALDAYRYLRSVGVEWRDNGAETMLYKKARANDVESVKLLQAEGVNGDELVDEGREAALVDAAALGHYEVVKLMLEAGADPDVMPEKALGNPLQRAYDREHDPIFMLLLEHGADPNVTERRSRRGLLEKTIHARKPELALALVQHGANTEISINGMSLMGRAISEGYDTLVEAMLDAGFSPGADRGAPLSSAARAGRKDLVDRFLEYPDAKPGSEAWWHALWLTGRQDDRGMFHYLLDAGPDTLPPPPDRFACIICGPAARGELDVVESFVERGFPVNGRAPDGDTALIRAARHARREVVEYLLAHGADANLRGEDGVTALAMSADSGRKEMQAILAEEARQAEQRRKEREAQEREYMAYVRELEERRRQEEERRRENRDRDGEARKAAELENARTVVITPPDDGNRASHEAPPQPQVTQISSIEPAIAVRHARRRPSEPKPADLVLVRQLIAAGAEVNAADKDGWTPLMRAAAAGNQEVAELLRANGADASLRNADGRTAAELAATSP